MTITTVLFIIVIIAVALMVATSYAFDDSILKCIFPSFLISSLFVFIILCTLEFIFKIIGSVWDCPEKYNIITKTPMEIVSMKETDDGKIILIVGEKMERVVYSSIKDYKTIKNGGKIVKVHEESRLFEPFTRDYFELVEPTNEKPN